MNFIKKKLVSVFVGILISLLTADKIKSFVADFIATIRTKIKDSATKIDDAVVLPLLDLLEEAFYIDDTPEVVVIQNELITTTITVLLSYVNAELVRTIIQFIITWVKEQVLGSKTTLDDNILLPFINLIEKSLLTEPINTSNK